MTYRSIIRRGLAWGTIAPIAFAGLASSALADEGRDPLWATATYGNGQRVDIYGVGLLWKPSWGAEWLARRGLEWRVGTDIMSWVGHATATNDRVLWDVDLTPYLRWNAKENASVFRGMFIEGGVGLQLLSRTRIGVGSEHWRNFSTAFQFGERVAVGCRFGAHDDYEVAAFLQHVSNAKIKDPNDGLTYFGLTVRIPLELH